jgi:DNA-binding MarR family transcriptional regulator
MAKSPIPAAAALVLPHAAPGAAPALSQLLGFHLRMAETAMHRDFIATLKELDLTQKLAAVLTLLAESPGSSQIDLSNILGADRASILALVDRLEHRDLIYRTRSRIDRRRQELYLSKAGIDVLARAKALIETHEARFKGLFSAKELENLMGYLARIERFAAS